eukprot:CAMPEP_0198684930 /NCGR_PEP_ID=MMETSP1468-20131203/12921_1 /TAXON_ID=1461545 /ORGANISM="Mantoniella sp, Strain CCMP1436" /LENGTH=183 /DNA_ID=CAMNT_0044430091 /DNA_START=109 /DNA_END=658 /DNA_ORIENTATION=-
MLRHPKVPRSTADIIELAESRSIVKRVNRQHYGEHKRVRDQVGDGADDAGGGHIHDIAHRRLCRSAFHQPLAAARVRPGPVLAVVSKRPLVAPARVPHSNDIRARALGRGVHVPVSAVIRQTPVAQETRHEEHVVVTSGPAHPACRGVAVPWTQRGHVQVPVIVVDDVDSGAKGVGLWGAVGP